MFDPISSIALIAAVVIASSNPVRYVQSFTSRRSDTSDITTSLGVPSITAEMVVTSEYVGKAHRKKMNRLRYNVASSLLNAQELPKVWASDIS